MLNKENEANVLTIAFGHILYILNPVLGEFIFFFFNDTAPTEIYTSLHTLSLHDALPLAVYPPGRGRVLGDAWRTVRRAPGPALRAVRRGLADAIAAFRTPHIALRQLALLPIGLAYAGRLPPTASRLHAHFASLPTAVVRVLAAFRGTSYGFTAHAYDIHARAHRRQLPARIAGAERVVTCTAYNRDLLASLARNPADAEKIVLCHHGLEVAAYTPGRACTYDLIVGGASLHPKKGLDRLVAACARLAARGVAFQCVLVGEG